MAEGLQVKMIAISPKDAFDKDVRKLFVTLNRAVRDESANGVRYMSYYPPVSGSAYRRTGTLRRSWSFRISSGGGLNEGLIQSNANIAPYNETVQGENQGDVFERIGWRNIKDLFSMIDKDFPKRIQNLIAKAM